MTNNTQPDQNKILFVNMISMLTMSAMQQLGKIVNPATGKAAVNLEGAQATIDMLDMLYAKTRGNLDNDESKMLKDTLTMLKLNYVETSKAKPDVVKPPEDGRKTDAGDGSKAAAGDQPTASGEKQPPESAGQAPSDAKFHKSYG